MYSIITEQMFSFYNGRIHKGPKVPFHYDDIIRCKLETETAVSILNDII